MLEGGKFSQALGRIAKILSSYVSWDSLIVQVFHVLESELGFESPHLKVFNFSKSLRTLPKEREEIESKLEGKWGVFQLGGGKFLVLAPVRVEGRDVGYLSVILRKPSSDVFDVLCVVAELLGFAFFTLCKERGERRVVGKMVFRSEKMKEVVELALKVANSDATLLIRGESGVGKELLVELIHENSPRRDKPLVKINCAAIPSELLESELFGYRKGAFTGALWDKKGKFEEADGGTIFLDEIGDMPLHLQAKILRVLQTKEIEPLGGKPKKVDVRIIAATHRDLEKLVEEGKFRHDLYYRLNVVPITIPPLRERREDIKPLVEHFLEKFNRKYGKNISISKGALDILMRYDWPGNVRELENLIERLVIVSSDLLITPDDIPEEIRRSVSGGKGEKRSFSKFSPTRIEKTYSSEEESHITISENHIPTLKDMEKELILKALSVANFKIKEAAKVLGITPRQLSYKMKKYGIGRK